MLITIECHEPMGRDRRVRQPWSDVSVSFIRQPGGITERFEPTLVSRTRLEQDLELARKRERKLSDKSNAAIDLLEKVIQGFNNGAEFYVNGASLDDKFPEIYTSNDHIDQPEAERMLIHFLKTQGLTEVGFQWVWPDSICSVG